MDGHKLELTEELVDLLKRSTDGHQFWGEYLEKLSVSEPILSPSIWLSCWNRISSTYSMVPRRSNPVFPRTASRRTIWLNPAMWCS